MNFRHIFRAACLLLATLAPAPAWSGLVGCSLSVPALTGTYSDAMNLDASGAVSITCTRDDNGKAIYHLRLMLAQTPTETLSNPYPDTLNYGVFTDALRSSRWTAQDTQINLTGNVKVGTATFTAYLRVPLGQVAKAAGVYNDGLAATVHLLSGPGGTPTSIVASGSLNTQVTVPKVCTFGTMLPSYALTYQAFQAAAITNTSQNLGLTCTKGTNYTLTLDQTTGIVPMVELRYLLFFTSTSGASVSALATSSTATQHGLTLTLPAGQAGSCSTGNCSGSSVRTVTITY